MPTDAEKKDADGWSKAIAIGFLAGIPTAGFLQVGFIQTMRERGAVVRPSQFGTGLLGSLLPAGIGVAAAVTAKEYSCFSRHMVLVICAFSQRRWFLLTHR